MSDAEQIRDILERWAYTTRMGLQDEVLANHAADLVVFDVLPPLKYESAEAYRKSWDEWQPETKGEGQMDLVI
jgi:ketosteroid isomerase-like protein